MEGGWGELPLVLGIVPSCKLMYYGIDMRGKPVLQLRILGVLAKRFHGKPMLDH